VIGKVALMALTALQVGTAAPTAHITKPTANAKCQVTVVLTWQGATGATQASISVTDVGHGGVGEASTAHASGKLTLVIPAVANPTQTTMNAVGKVSNAKGKTLAVARSTAKLDCIFG
jgi:hypothetical protein